MPRVIFEELIDDLIEYAWVMGLMVSLPLAILLWRRFQRWRHKRGLGLALESPYEAFYKSESEHFRERLSELLTATRFGGFWLIFQVIVTIVALVQYIAETYAEGQRQPLLAYLELLTTLIFTADFILFFIASSNRLAYTISPLAITDQLTVLPVYIALARGTFWLATNSFFRPLRVIRAGRISQVYRLLSLSRTSVQRQLVTVILTVAVLVFLGASIIQIVEAIGDNAQLLEFHQAVYFIVVTFTTVGYGDFTPKTVQGQLVMILMIIIGFFMVSFQSGKLINLLSSRSPFEGRYSPDSLHPHIVVAGDITYNSVVYFFKELYHRSRQADKLRVVFMTKNEPSLDLKILLEHPFYNARVKYFVGSVLNSEDQRRAALAEAVACFIMNNKFRSQDPDSDSEVILRALSVKEHADVPVVVQLHKKRSSQYLSDASIDVVVPMDEIRMLIMGQNCMAPGFSTLISNLVHTFSPKKERPEFRHLWAEEYYKGCTNQFYNVRFSDKFRGTRFTTLVRHIYSATKCILFAIQTEKHESGDTLTLLNPSRSYYIGGGEVGIVIGTHDASSNLTEVIDSYAKFNSHIYILSSIRKFFHRRSIYSVWRSFDPDEWESDSPQPLDDTDVVPLDPIVTRPPSPLKESFPQPPSPIAPRSPLSASGATFLRVKRHAKSNQRFHKTELGLFVDAGDDDAGDMENFDRPTADEVAEDEATHSDDSAPISPRDSSLVEDVPERAISQSHKENGETSSDILPRNLASGNSPPENPSSTTQSPGLKKRSKRSYSTGPQHSQNDLSSSIDIRQPGYISRRVASQEITESGDISTQVSTVGSTDIRKSVQFSDVPPSIHSSSTSRRMTLGDRLKLIKEQSESLRNSGRQGSRDLRRASMDVDRLNSESNYPSTGGDEDYAQTISTEQPFSLELTRLRADLRQSEFKREKFVAPVTESISTVLFEERASGRKGRPSNDDAAQPSSRADRLSQNYYLLPAPRKTKDFVVTGKDYMFTHSEKHILICGEAFKRSFIHIITPMRSSKLGASRLCPIVFLHSTLPSSYELKIMSQYPEVYFVEGSMLSDFDLRRAGIKSANKVVLLTTVDRPGTLGKAEKPELVDSSVIFAFRNIHLHFPSVELVVAEMVEGPNMRFLDVGQAFQDRVSRLGKGIGIYNTLVQVMRESRTSGEWMSSQHGRAAGRKWTNVSQLTQWFQSRSDDYSVLDYPEYHFRPLFAGGQVWAASMVDSLFAQIMYNPSLLNIVRLLSGGSPDPDYFATSSNVFQVPLPTSESGFVGRTWADLFFHFLSLGIVTLALYRSHPGSECRNAYVYTNPDPETVLATEDRAFVLALQDPEESVFT